MYCIDHINECDGCLDCAERAPSCPVCGEETETVYIDEWGDVHGCPHCLEEVANGEA